ALGEKLSDEVRDYVQTANEAAHSLLTLLNDILDFSKLESGKFTIEAEPFRLREMFDETVKTLSARAFEKGLELVCEVASDVPDRLVGDAVRLRQVFTNLISNAIKFTEQGEVVVSVQTLHKWPKETRLRFSVRDTGVGVSANDQLRILEPFTQVDASSTRRYGGTGLGLTICRELVRLMGGQLRVESELGVGSCFSFRLTLPIQPEPTSDSLDSTPLDRLRGLPVLVVDDNETNRRIITEILASWSMQADTARDGQQALARLDQARESGPPYALLIVDALMPEVDGYALSQQIAERISDPPPVILMLSSSDRHEFKLREERASISAFLQKPVSQSDLLEAVLRAMNAPIAIGRETPPSNVVPAPSRVSLSILLAEDTPANQKIVTSILKKRGHAITVAGNGREAVELFRQQAFDVILMDVQMPIMDGWQATAAIREQEKSPDQSTPIIAMTAHAMRGDREKCLDAGMDAYIAKPIDMNRLIELVESVADGTTDSRFVNEDHRAAHRVAKSNGVIDFAGAMQRLAGDLELFRDFIGYFDQDSPKLLSALRDAISEGDASAVQRCAHSIKGLAANFGAVLCVAVAHELEEIGKAGELGTAAEVMARLERELARLDDALAEHRS
ncbi:MAG: response regulator, partial [Planctomycetia bacterium]|nr:response regulator [Planctomycetia bacterium]